MTTAPIICVTLNPAIDCVYEVPNLRVGEHVKGRCRQRVAAGKGVNVARTVRLLGQEAAAAGLLGREAHTLYADTLTAEDVACDFVLIDGATRQNITLVDPEQRTETHIRDRGFEARPADLDELRQRLARRLSPGQIIAFCGSLPPGLAAADLVALIDSCRRRGCRVAIDIEGSTLAQLGEAALWSAKPNRAELAEWAGAPIETEATLVEHGRRLQRRVAELLVSCGADGAYLFTATGAWRGRFTAAGPDVVSTVSCGDCFLGGYLAARRRAAEPVDALRQALAAGAAAAASALPGRFDAHLAESLATEIAISPA